MSEDFDDVDLNAPTHKNEWPPKMHINWGEISAKVAAFIVIIFLLMIFVGCCLRLIEWIWP